MYESGTYLELTFKDVEDNDIIFFFPYAKPSASSANVKALMQAFLDNGTIFNRVPVQSISACEITVSRSSYNL